MYSIWALCNVTAVITPHRNSVLIAFTKRFLYECETSQTVSARSLLYDNGCFQKRQLLTEALVEFLAVAQSQHVPLDLIDGRGKNCERKPCASAVRL